MSACVGLFAMYLLGRPLDRYVRLCDFILVALYMTAHGSSMLCRAIQRRSCKFNDMKCFYQTYYIALAIFAWAIEAARRASGNRFTYSPIGI